MGRGGKRKGLKQGNRQAGKARYSGMWAAELVLVDKAGIEAAFLPPLFARVCMAERCAFVDSGRTETRLGKRIYIVPTPLFVAAVRIFFTWVIFKMVLAQQERSAQTWNTRTVQRHAGTAHLERKWKKVTLIAQACC